MNTPNSDTSETSQLRQAFNNDHDTMMNGVTLDHYCQLGDHAENLERERDEARKALKRQSQNYFSLYEAVLGDGCSTSEVKDVDGIARQHRTERYQLRKVCDEQQKVISIARNDTAPCLLEAGLELEASKLRWYCDRSTELYIKLPHVKK